MTGPNKINWCFKFPAFDFGICFIVFGQFWKKVSEFIIIILA